MSVDTDRGQGGSGRWSSSLIAGAAILSLLTVAARADGVIAEKTGTPLKPGGLSNLWDPRTSPFIPIPEIGTDPNSGTTVGILPVFLSSEHDQITRIVAPDLIYNPNLGYGGS